MVHRLLACLLGMFLLFSWNGPSSAASDSPESEPVTILTPSLELAKAEAAAFAVVPTRAASVSAGANHACLLTAAGEIWCWGENYEGQLGDGTTEAYRSWPRPIGGPAFGFTAVAAGSDFTCVITAAGHVQCWGMNAHGQLGNGTTVNTTTPVALSGMNERVVALTAGGATDSQGHACALTSAGAVWCWGSNDYGQLGDGTAIERRTPVPVNGLASGVVGIAAGGKHTCAVTGAGEVLCWGYNSSGQLGDGTLQRRLVPTGVSGLATGVASVGTGTEHTCALMAAGGVQCWGDNYYYQLGQVGVSLRTTPAVVGGLEAGVDTLTAGAYHNCARLTSGGLRCWGSNVDGELGRDDTAFGPTPVGVIGLAADVVSVDGGGYFTCATTRVGAAWCWGGNVVGQLGNGTTSRRTTPVAVQGLTEGTTGVTVSGNTSCALIAGGHARCWGFAYFGGSGNTTSRVHYTPAILEGLAGGATAVRTGYQHTCALLDTGEVWCGGANHQGQLGDGTTTDRRTPAPVTGLPAGASALSAGWRHTCAIAGSGGLWCWGDNSEGQLGDGTRTTRLAPVPVAGLEGGVVAVTAGSHHTCALKEGDGLWCWGSNGAGQLGDGTETNRLEPVAVVGLGDVVSVAAGNAHTCAVTATGGLWCWGYNGKGALGVSASPPHTLPVAVTGMASGVSAVATGSDHTCAVTGEGKLWCWGDNIDGQLGNGDRKAVGAPVPVFGLTSGVTAVGAGDNHTCAVDSAGRVWCWGQNEYGQLGVNPGWTPMGVLGFPGFELVYLPVVGWR